MGASLVSDTVTIASHKGPYKILFDENVLAELNSEVPDDAHFIIDKKVAALYRSQMQNVLNAPSVLLLVADENKKSLNQMPKYVDHLVNRGIRRGHRLIAIGGGVIQDITCFLAAILLRGVDWEFYPTTLLAQADSCIGSKSSINSGATKNILGTFTPPRVIFLSTDFLETLDDRDIRSGVGEILKVHAIDGPISFDTITSEYETIFSNKNIMAYYVRQALKIKKAYIEEDEFDRGPRNIFNYGHTFGHAIEAAVDFTIPHGIAVTIGMDMANWMSWHLGVGSKSTYNRMHPVLAKNYDGFAKTPIPIDAFIAAISKDKKNVGSALTLILPDAEGHLSRGRYSNDKEFQSLSATYLSSAR